MEAKKEQQLEKAYQSFIDSFTVKDFPLEKVSSFVDVGISGYGTTTDEYIKNVDDYIELIQSQREQGEGLEVKWHRKPILKKINPAEDAALYVEELNVTMKLDHGVHEIPLRVSSLFHFSNNAWKVVHWHGSQPVATENDTWHLDDWRHKNEALQQLVNEKTADLAAKNRELEIEAALERVRARTMAMQKSEDLSETSAEMFKIIQELGMEQWSCGFNIFDYENNTITQWLSSGDGRMMVPFITPSNEDVFQEITEAARKGETLFIKEMSGKELEAHYTYMKSLPQVAEVIKDLGDAGFDVPTHQILNIANFSYGYLIFITYEQVPKAHDLFKRFAKVFEQTYTRFLDLQKAEAQAREAQIEASLERVRARSMGMKHSNELKEVAAVLFKQLSQLKIEAHNAWVTLVHSKANTLTMWKTKADGKMQPEPFVNPGSAHPLFQAVIDAWKAGEKVMEIPMPKKVAEKINLEAFDQKLNLPVEAKTYTALEIRHRYGTLGFSTWLSISEDEKAIIQRFAKVFEQTYTRFLDLQKAEEQAWEAQIETALEKVRSRSLAMHKSEELADISLELVKQVQALGEETWFCAFNIYDDDPQGSWEWGSNGEGTFPKYRTPREGIFLRYYKAGQQGKTLLINEIGPEECPAHYDYLCSLPGVGEQLLKMKDNSISFPESQIDHVAFFKYGYVLFITYDPVPELHDVFKRFAKVFEQSYTRFLDLQKAENQAREAQIEAALERVRSRSMAMHKSSELLEVITVVSEQLLQLNFRFNHVSFANNDLDQDYKFWVSAIGIPKPMSFNVPYLDIPLIKNMRDAQRNGTTFYTDILTKQENRQWHKHLLNNGGAHVFSKEVNEYSMSRGMARSIAIHPNIILILANYASVPYSEEENKIIARFGQVFEQSYTRFLDLQKAEAQTKEAQIEAALEKVRSRSMAMHKSDELLEVINLVSEQLDQQNFRFNLVCFLKNDPGRDHTFWIAAKGLPNPIILNVPYLDIPMFNNIKEAEQNGLTFCADIQTVEEQRLWHNHLLNHGGAGIFPKELNEYVMDRGMARSIAINPNIILLLVNYASVPYSESENIIIARFGQVFDQTYTRFLDLQKAEAQARESTIEAALEKVRGKAMGMHSSEDLSLTVDAFFKELHSLNVAPHRCGVTLIDRETRMANLTVTTATSGGKAKKVKGALKLSGHLVLDSVYEHWKMQKEYHAILHGAEIQAYYHAMNPEIEFPDYANDKTQFGYYFFFKEGGVYAWTDVELEEEELLIFRRFTTVLSLTYRRFMDLKESEALAQQAKEDLVKLQIEKKRAEDALTILKSTQSQLIQSEKMASLGELTAGIAHEIQNPLNFVNNFSEVSNEMIKEIQEERRKNKEEQDEALTDEILADIEQNLEKINHHGNRAGDIVKGMLQHSRAGSGKKEPTDINALCDEYLRLAYHGLRAKDKSFNATMLTEFDESIEKVNIIPQDIGRVILNLITNAFYIVNEKSKESTEGYEPTVSVSTKKEDGKILLSVKDNGNGIPDDIKEKIFQPFFTTKPTGQGTGLGLSLSYDIVKAHGGDLSVETNHIEGLTAEALAEAGSEFIISLPM